MDEKFEVNPFDRTALTDYRQLAGRTDEFRRIRFVLRNSAKSKSRIKSILITGERGVGKTSILNLTESECEINNLIPVRIDLTELNSVNSCDFFWHFFSQAINKLFSLGLFSGKNGAIDLMIQKILNSNGIEDQANWVFHTPILRRNFLNNRNSNFEFHLFIEDLKLMRKEICDSDGTKYNEHTKILFLVDEVQHIYSSKEIIEQLRFVLQSAELATGFVFAGDSSYKTSQWESVFGGSYRDFEIISLNYFNDVESVGDYFKKSLTSVNWTEKEIEETLFYRFKLACRQIFQLTSGKPAWINTIASKMFERCMSGEVKLMKFDKPAQMDVKRILEDSGELDMAQLQFIEHLQRKYVKWLSEIFASELHTFRQVYLFAKFKLSDDNFLSEKQFEDFCKQLITHKIINVISEDKQTNIVGFSPSNSTKEFLDQNYYAFDLKSDTIKQWLQISSDGIYQFRFEYPSRRFMGYINDVLVTEIGNTALIEHSPTMENDIFRLLDVIKKVNNRTYEISEETYETVLVIFKAFKKIENSRDKEILYIEFKNLKNGKSRSWNIYNYNDKNKIISYRESPSTVKKIKDTIKSYNNDSHNYEIEIIIDKLPQPDLSALQSLIIESGDTRKIGIILEDKMADLVRLYIKESNVDSSYEIANFFYKLFNEGHDLSLRYLNNSAYVFIERNELDKALDFLNEANRKNSIFDVENNDLSVVALIKYNLAIISVMQNEYSKALNLFKQVVAFCEAKEITDDLAGTLKIVEISSEQKVCINEIKHNDKSNPKIKISEFSQLNIEKLSNLFETKPMPDIN